MNVERKNLSADVLVIGGGIGGLTAACSIKECNPDMDVLILEKQTAGYSGKANKGGGVLQYFDLEHMNPMDFVGFHANTVGAFFGDQDLMLRYVSMNHEMLEKLESWGVRVPRDEKGSFRVVRTGPMTGMIGVDLDITLKVRATATRLGVRIMDKITMTDLLTAEGKIAGATAYSILDGTFYTVSSKAVVLATGSQDYRLVPMWSSARGDGIAAAYRAGVEMRNPEFGNFAQLLKKRTHQEIVFGENVMYNGLGENITKNFRRFREPDINSNAIAEWYNEMSAGRGPVVLHTQESGETKNETMMFTLWDRPYGLPFWETNFRKCAESGDEPEVVPTLIGEQSPVKVGHDMQTNVPGLFAIGDVSYCGSTLPGAVPAPPGRNRGSGILNAVFAGILCAQPAIDAALSSNQPQLNDKQVEASYTRTYAPLERTEGIHPKVIMDKVLQIMGPMENSVYMNEYRLTIALRKLEEVKKLVPQMKADDFHWLLTCHEAEAGVLCAEMQLRASLMRKESRGWFLREDHPQIDNQNFLKYILVKNMDGEMVFSTEDVPVERWPIKPPMM